MKAMKKVGAGIEEGPDADKAEEEFDDYANGFDKYDDEDSTAQSLVQRHSNGHGKHRKHHQKHSKHANAPKEGDELDQSEPKVPSKVPKNVGGNPKDKPDETVED